jgi:hypothetical protein
MNQLTFISVVAPDEATARTLIEAELRQRREWQRLRALLKLPPTIEPLGTVLIGSV